MPFKSLDEMLEVASLSSSSDALKIQRSDLKLLFKESALNSLVFAESFAKLCFTWCAVSEFLRHGKVIYIDLDTVFTSYVRNGIFPSPSDDNIVGEDNKLLLYMPAANQLEDMLAEVSSGINQETRLIVIDSLNSFYTLYDDGANVASMNHLLVSYVSLLLHQCKMFRASLLLTSMIRHKKTTEWILAPSSSRLIEARSSVILRADLVQESLALSLVKHETVGRQVRMILARSELPTLS